MAPITNVLPFDGLDKHHIMNTHRMMGTHHIDLTKKIEFPHIYSKMVELHQNVYQSFYQPLNETFTFGGFCVKHYCH